MYIDNGFTTVIYTDHESLKYMNTIKNLSKRLARWIEEFSEYNLDIRYRKGKDNVVIDALSCRPDFLGVTKDSEAQVMLVRGVNKDEWATHMQAFLHDNTNPPPPLDYDIRNNAQLFDLDNEGRLVHKTEFGMSPYLEVPFRADTLEWFHKEYGHLGYPGLVGVVSARCWWHSLDKDIKNYTHICPSCQVSQRSR